MLEAFKASGDGASETPSPAAPRALEPSSAGPFAPPAPATKRPLHPAVRDLEDDGIETFEIPIGPRAFFVAQAIALVIAFLIGRFSVSPVQAGAERTPGAGPAEVHLADAPRAARQAGGPSTERPPAEPRTEAERQLSDADETFLDPGNKVTIIAITYPDSQLGEELAFETYDFLKGKQFPVVTPRRRGSYLYLLVGAAPSRKEIAPLCESLRATSGPDGRSKPFADAYVVNSADYR